jgi:hypothetical protein
MLDFLQRGGEKKLERPKNRCAYVRDTYGKDMTKSVDILENYDPMLQLKT